MVAPKWHVGLIGAFIVASCLGIGVLFVAPRTQVHSELFPTAIVEVIPAPTLTPSLPPTFSAIAQREEEATPGASTTISGRIAVGDSVQIYGTQGKGLRLRAAPGLESEIRFLAFEGEIYTVMDGPREASGYVWWYLVAPYDEEIKGWAAEDYLRVIEGSD